MTKKIHDSSTGVSSIDELLEELRPYLYVGTVTPAIAPSGTLDLRGRVRLPEGISPTSNAQTRRILLDGLEEIVTLLGNRLRAEPEITIKGDPLIYADVRLTVGYE